MPALTGIRFPLALWVVAHHIAHVDPLLSRWTTSSPVLNGVIQSAWLALTAFFAISGFVLARRYRHAAWTRASAVQYAAARFGRIYPLYFLSLLILLPIIARALADDRIGSVAARVGLIVNYLFLLQGWHPPAVEWNTPAWSLSCEMFFYASMPFILRALGAVSWRRGVAAACVACAIPVVLRLTMAPPIPKALLYFGDFLIGMAAASVYDDLRARRLPLARLGAWLYGPAIAAGIGLVLARDVIGSFLLFDFGIRVSSALAVLGLACGGGWGVRALTTRAMLAGGRASYAIYILHVPILWWYRRSDLRAMLPDAGVGVGYLAIVLACSVAAARWYEPLTNRFIRRRFAAESHERAYVAIPTPVAHARLSVREDAASRG